MPKPIDDDTIVDMDQYRPLRASLQNDRIDWLSLPEVKLMTDLLASEDAEGMGEFMALEEGTPVTLELEITDSRLAQAVLHSIGMSESFIPGMNIKHIKLNPEKEPPNE